MANSLKGVLDLNGKPIVQTVRNYFRCLVFGWNIDNPKSFDFERSYRFYHQWRYMPPEIFRTFTLALR